MRTRILRALVMLATVACSLAMVTPARAAVSKQALPPDPQALPPTGNCVIDNIFYGAVPPGGSHAPVLVFVHGLSGLALDWWTDQTYAGRNEMYSRAYGAGYRTAFVNLNVDDNTPPDCSVERRPANDNYVNGAVLAQQLDAITQYYGVSQVDIIAHSKGGIDAQTAIVWSGARSKVHSLFTMGTPHQGSILVDQLWSPEGAWLAGLLGQLDDAICHADAGDAGVPCRHRSINRGRRRELLLRRRQLLGRAGRTDPADYGQLATEPSGRG
ncbi:MAG: hypothetical protein KDH86_06490 [Anaerolineae bacterium]|nr:hypothetical protein [Anaerolineae bacterium]